MSIKTVTVIGANGKMGSNICGIFASFGGAKVYAMCRTKEKALAAVEKAAKSVKCESIQRNLIAADYEDMEKCVRESDLIFESVAEQETVKKSVLQRAAEFMRENAILCTGTSGLSVEKLSECIPERVQKCFMGMHFFNPPYNLILCEMIATQKVNRELFDSLCDYAENQLLRKVVKVTDTPGFLGNRIGFQFINKAVQYADKYKKDGGIDYIDSILGGFTGRAMPPIMTSDFVGLDVHKFIVDYIKENTNDFENNSFVFPEYAERLVTEGKLGKKVQQGFYKTIIDEGKKVQCVYDIETGEYRRVKNYHLYFAEKMREFIQESRYLEAYELLRNSQEKEAEICKEFLVDYVLYSVIINETVGESRYAADDAMAYGFNWCPPLGIVEVLGGKDIFLNMVEEYLIKHNIKEINRNKVETLIVKSQYNYAKFFKV